MTVPLPIAAPDPPVHPLRGVPGLRASSAAARRLLPWPDAVHRLADDALRPHTHVDPDADVLSDMGVGSQDATCPQDGARVDDRPAPYRRAGTDLNPGHQHDALLQGGAVRHRRSGADHAERAHLDAGPDHRVVADFRSGTQVGADSHERALADCDVGRDPRVVCDQGAGVDPRGVGVSSCTGGPCARGGGSSWRSHARSYQNLPRAPFAALTDREGGRRPGPSPQGLAALPRRPGTETSGARAPGPWRRGAGGGGVPWPAE